jgi:hypothetical protein
MVFSPVSISKLYLIVVIKGRPAPAFFISAGCFQAGSPVARDHRTGRKKVPLVPSYHYLPYGHTCYTFPNVKYVTERYLINSVTIYLN